MMALKTAVLLLVSYNAITIKASESTSQISNANEKFSTKLYDILVEKEGNLLYAPISIHAVLSLLQQGAAGSTAQNLQRVLNLPDAKTALGGYRILMENLNSVEDVKLHIANKVYVQEAYRLTEQFSSVARTNFFADTENVNFAKKTEAANIINDWVEVKTNNTIKDLIKPGDLDMLTRLVLVNAIYFKGEWEHKFEKTRTVQEKFFLSETDVVNCQMMYTHGEFRFGEDGDLNADIVDLPYKNPMLSLTVILPKSKTGISDLENKLQTKKLSSIYGRLQFQDVALSLPKFKIETEINLNEPLSEIGLADIFSDLADFSNMLDSPEQLAVSKVVQKAFIEVNEEGAEAAAATGVIAVFRSARPFRQIFRADHPFIFVLSYRNEEEFVPLFIGKLARP